ncbi:adenylate/guanylate cyclase domain-containing protein [Actinoplanes bogorensis]|uniref:Adenylate/guanylate cyclase domain-containing protein n=1 Tax=Paractinoplanes bogorensis TaxID=1610840 RepID=A0ABS5YK37_9ACTN|nr:adenylate/guanylate cyclase domain-containing protein [Actinoplanes bogorensis]MBU2663049.1 adenylate/guanylate cyclase domain-containing protein [Actinoplanes bogorensis]
MSGRTELPSGLVTFVFTDIEGSTRLARMLGDDYGSVLGDHRSVMRAALSYFNGVELFTEGDSFFIAFPDPGAAVAACVEAQRQLSAHDWPSPDVAPRVRMGMHTGWARPIGDEYASAEVHRAARVSAAAHGGQILCSGATALSLITKGTEVPFALTSQEKEQRAEFDLLDLGPFRLRGFDDDEQLFQILATGLDRDFPRPRTPGAALHNLPTPLTSFVGRRSERAEVSELVHGHRIVTVAGPGGAGKTRLALQVGEDLLPAYGEGVWNVDVAEARNGLAPALAAALGVRTEPGRPVLETLLERCADRRLLIVLQTADAAPAACATLVRRLLARCPQVRVLVTSRVPLNVPGEVVWRIPPMSPADAFMLLDERTTEARGGRPSPIGEHADLADIAVRLEGSPLAAELAAARLRSLSAAQLATRLDDPLAALDPVEAPAEHRHDSLSATLDWSYRTLSGPAAGLLRRLAVFAGTVDLATVEWCGTEALGALSELTDKSLVEVVPGPRYRLSGQVRSFASRRLTAAGDEHAARDRHAAWALHTLESVAIDTDGQPRTTSLTDMAPYVPEWQTALHWTATHGSVRTGLCLALALDPWWREHGGANEGRDLLFRLYQRLDGVDVPPATLGYVHLVHAGLTDDRAERSRFLDRAERIARVEENRELLVRSRAGHRSTLVAAGRFTEAEQLCREVIAEAERGGVAESALPAVIALAELLWRRDALTSAAELLGGARQAEASCPEHRGKRTVDWLLGMVALRRGDLVAGHDHLVVALRSRLRHGFSGPAADAVAAIAVRCAMGGDPATAAVLFGGAEAARGARRTEMFGRFWSDQQIAVRSALGDAAFDAAYADGVGLGFDRIVAMALAVEHPDLEDGAARFAQTLQG